MNIVCGTDFTENARRAATVSAHLAAGTGGQLLLAHAAERLGGSAAPREVRQALYGYAQASLRREALRLSRLGAKVREHLLCDAPDKALITLASRSRSDLLVVSSLGRRAPARWLLGSVAERVAQSSPIPTLVVRAAAPFVAWLQRQRPLRVLIGADSTGAGDAAMKFAAAWRAVAPCKLVVASSEWPPEARMVFGAAEEREIRSPSQVEQEIQQRLRHLARRMRLGAAKIRVEANWGRPDLHLIEMATEERADLLMVGTHQRRGLDRLWHGSVSRGVLHNAPMSVLCVPLKKSGKAWKLG